MQTTEIETAKPKRQRPPASDPLVISASETRRILGIGNTKFWALVKAGKIEMRSGIGARRMVVYASVKSLAAA